jgi:hypothetical protein
MISATKEDIGKVQHPDWSAKFPPKAGGGYIAATIGTHQLHCLHYIWQDHHMDYFPKTQDKKQRVPELYELHNEHCVDYIRLSLMCQFDTGIIPYKWVLDHQNPTPNANTHQNVWIGVRSKAGWRHGRWKSQRTLLGASLRMPFRGKTMRGNNQHQARAPLAWPGLTEEAF